MDLIDIQEFKLDSFTKKATRPVLQSFDLGLLFLISVGRYKILTCLTYIWLTDKLNYIIISSNRSGSICSIYILIIMFKRT